MHPTHPIHVSAEIRAEVAGRLELRRGILAGLEGRPVWVYASVLGDVLTVVLQAIQYDRAHGGAHEACRDRWAEVLWDSLAGVAGAPVDGAGTYGLDRDLHATVTALVAARAAARLEVAS